MARADPRDRGLYSRVDKQGRERWYVRISAGGRMQTFAPHGGFPSKREAKTFLDDARTKLRHGTFFPEQYKAGLTVPLAELLDADAERDRAKPIKNRAAYRRFWRTFAGEKDARTLPPSLIDDARRELEGRAFRPQTVHHYLGYLRSLLNFAKRDALIDRTPFDQVKLPPVHNHRERFYSFEERQKFYEALGHWCEAAEFAGLTGLRWSEQFRLERESVNWREGYVTLPKTKAKRPQIRLLNTRAREICRRQLARHKAKWLYPNQAGGPMDYHNFRRRIWAPACAAAGITNAKWNDWRHTFASDLTMQGHSDRTVAELMGHTSTQMVKRYAHLAPSHLREAVEGLGGGKP